MKRQWMLITVAVLLALLSSLEPVAAQTLGPQDEKDHAPRCSNMLESQVTGSQPGSACRVPVIMIAPSADDLGVFSSLSRRGSTYRWTSQSESDLVEDEIKVEGYLYWWVNDGWSYDDQCDDSNLTSSRAVCRTYGGGNTNKSEGFHYFHTSGYVDDSFWSSHTGWSS